MKERLDVLLYEKGLAESREKAKRLIMAGIVFVANQRVDKAGTKVNTDDEIEVRGDKNPYVSRGGFKLEKALKEFEISAENKICMDVGASSGGFTDVLLQNGASKVYSIDVGHGQLAYKLREDSKVIVLEKTNFRNMEFDKVGELIDLAVMDVSFISVLKLADNLLNFLKEDGEYICLIKPQFEAGKEEVGKNGVVKDSKVHKKVLENVISGLKEKGLYLKKLDYSPIKGPKGNIEFIALFDKNEENSINMNLLINNTIENAQNKL